MEIKFGEEISFPDQKYIGLTDPGKHIEHCRMIWQDHQRQEWVH